MTYVAVVRKLLSRYDIYSLFRCFPYIRGAGYDEEFKDVGDGQTSLSRRVFEWLASIRSSHLAYSSWGYLLLGTLCPESVCSSVRV